MRTYTTYDVRRRHIYIYIYKQKFRSNERLGWLAPARQLLASIANITLHSTEDGWRGPDSKRCRQSTGGATTSTEPVLRTGTEAESKATRSKEHPRDRFRAAQTPSSDRVGVSEPSRAQTNVESHCRCPQKSCSQSSSASNGRGGSSLSWYYTSTRTWSQW